MIEEDIIGAIADAKNTDPTKVDLALQNWIEVDSVRQLAEQDCTDWTLRFEVPDYTVTVTGEEEILVDGRSG